MCLAWLRSAHPWIHRHHTSSTNSAEAAWHFAVTLGILEAMDTTWISTLWHHKKQIQARNLLVMEMEASHFIKSAGYSHTSPVHSSSWSLLLSMNPDKSFIWVLASLKLLGFPSPSSLPQAGWSHAGIWSLPAGKPEELCPANMHPLKPHRPPQLQLGQLLHSTTCICQGPCK